VHDKNDVACTADLPTTAAATSTTSTMTTSESTTRSTRTPDDIPSTLTGRVSSNTRAQVTEQKLYNLLAEYHFENAAVSVSG